LVDQDAGYVLAKVHLHHGQPELARHRLDGDLRGPRRRHRHPDEQLARAPLDLAPGHAALPFLDRSMAFVMMSADCGNFRSSARFTSVDTGLAFRDGMRSASSTP